MCLCTMYARSLIVVALNHKIHTMSPVTHNFTCTHPPHFPLQPLPLFLISLFIALVGCLVGCSYCSRCADCRDGWGEQIMYYIMFYIMYYIMCIIYLYFICVFYICIICVFYMCIIYVYFICVLFVCICMNIIPQYNIFVYMYLMYSDVWTNVGNGFSGYGHRQEGSRSAASRIQTIHRLYNRTQVSWWVLWANGIHFVSAATTFIFLVVVVVECMNEAETYSLVWFHSIDCRYYVHETLSRRFRYPAIYSNSYPRSSSHDGVRHTQNWDHTHMRQNPGDECGPAGGVRAPPRSTATSQWPIPSSGCRAWQGWARWRRWWHHRSADCNRIVWLQPIRRLQPYSRC